MPCIFRYWPLSLTLMFVACRDQPEAAHQDQDRQPPPATAGKSPQRTAAIEREAAAKTQARAVGKQEGDDIGEAKTVPDLRRWMASVHKRGVTSEEQAQALAVALQRIAAARGVKKSEVAAELLSGTAGELPGRECSDLIAALRQEPQVYIEAAKSGLSGNIQKKAIIMCVSNLEKGGEIELLESARLAIEPGGLLEMTAGHLIIATYRKRGLDASLERIEAFETPGERCVALSDLANQIVETGVANIPQAGLDRVLELARKDRFETAIKLLLQRDPKR